MDISIPHKPQQESPAPNPWRAVLELRRGSGPDLGGERRAEDNPLMIGLGVGVLIGLSFGMVLIAFFYWLIG